MCVSPTASRCALTDSDIEHTSPRVCLCLSARPLMGHVARQSSSASHAVRKRGVNNTGQRHSALGSGPCGTPRNGSLKYDLYSAAAFVYLHVVQRCNLYSKCVFWGFYTPLEGHWNSEVFNMFSSLPEGRCLVSQWDPSVGIRRTGRPPVVATVAEFISGSGLCGCVTLRYPSS